MAMITGIEKITASINKAISRMKKTSSRGLAEAALFVAAEAVKRAPIESGDLKNSVYVDLDGKNLAKGETLTLNSTIGGDAKIAEIGFASKYARRQHEDTSLRHDRSDGYRIQEINERTGKPNKHAGQTYNMVPGGQSKYLESVLIDHQDRILKRIADSTDINGGGGDDA